MSYHFRVVTLLAVHNFGPVGGIGGFEFIGTMARAVKVNGGIFINVTVRVAAATLTFSGIDLATISFRDSPIMTTVNTTPGSRNFELFQKLKLGLDQPIGPSTFTALKNFFNDVLRNIFNVIGDVRRRHSGLIFGRERVLPAGAVSNCSLLSEREMFRREKLAIAVHPPAFINIGMLVHVLDNFLS